MSTPKEKYDLFEKMPIAKWVIKISEGKSIYQTNRRTRKQMKKEFYESRIKPDLKRI